MYSRQPGIWEASGIGDYESTGRWDWEFYPPPYDFLAPANSAVMRPPVIPPDAFAGGLSGCGCSCGGSCGGDGCGSGLGQTGLFGTSLFESMDMSTWGVGEWGTIALGAYVLYSLLADTRSAVKTVRKVRSRARSKKRQQLQEQLDAV